MTEQPAGAGAQRPQNAQLECSRLELLGLSAEPTPFKTAIRDSLWPFQHDKTMEADCLSLRQPTLSKTQEENRATLFKCLAFQYFTEAPILFHSSEWKRVHAFTAALFDVQVYIYYSQQVFHLYVFLCELHCGLLSLASTVLCVSFLTLLLYVNGKLKTWMFDKRTMISPVSAVPSFFLKKIRHLLEDKRMQYDWSTKKVDKSSLYLLCIYFLFYYSFYSYIINWILDITWESFQDRLRLQTLGDNRSCFTYYFVPKAQRQDIVA